MNDVKNDLSLPVLVVDDDPQVLELSGINLRSQGIACITASSVTAAISALKDHEIAALILDWKLGEESGIKVLHVARDIRPETPIIVMSALGSETWNIMRESLNAGADSFIEKPLSDYIPYLKLVLRRGQQHRFLPERPEQILPFEEFKRIYVQHALKLCNENISDTADKLHIHRHTIRKFKDNPSNSKTT